MREDASTAAPPKVDGRRERTKRTRAAIVGALTALLDEGRIEPTAAEIAERADVAVRSIAQHFASREELLLAVAEHHARRLAHAPIDATGTFDERLEKLVASRTKSLEASSAMRRAAAVVLGRSPAVARALDRAARERREETARVFARELAAARDPAAAERAVALLTSGRAWDALRGEMGLGVKAARDQTAFAIRALLKDSPE
jgi:TetR/AcrR family transcriptional regulator of autoinduction and epiphytic fitness